MFDRVLKIGSVSAVKAYIQPVVSRESVMAFALRRPSRFWSREIYPLAVIGITALLPVNPVQFGVTLIAVGASFAIGSVIFLGGSEPAPMA